MISDMMLGKSRRKLVAERSLSLFLLCMFSVTSQAAENSCTDTSVIAADMILKRQLSALKNMERGRKCSAESAQGGFFNACRDLSLRRGEIEKKLQGSAAALARCNARSVAGNVSLKRTSKTSESGKKPELNHNQFIGQYSGTPLLFCVRLSDGYYFPAPHSQYSKSDKVKETLGQCRFICESKDVNLYILGDPAAETAHMLSVDKRESYLKLPTAYNYQGDEKFRKCNWGKYFAYIKHIQTRKVKSKKSTLMNISSISNQAESGGSSVLSGYSEKETSERAVRIIGPAFFQGENTAPVNFLNGDVQ